MQQAVEEDSTREEVTAEFDDRFSRWTISESRFVNKKGAKDGLLKQGHGRLYKRELALEEVVCRGPERSTLPARKKDRPLLFQSSPGSFGQYTLGCEPRHRDLGPKRFPRRLWRQLPSLVIQLACLPASARLNLITQTAQTPTKHPPPLSVPSLSHRITTPPSNTCFSASSTGSIQSRLQALLPPPCRASTSQTTTAMQRCTREAFPSPRPQAQVQLS